MLRLLVVSLVFFGFAFHSLSFFGSLDRAFPIGGGLNDIFHWGFLQVVFVMLVVYLCSSINGAIGTKTALSILPIPFSIIATITFLVGSLKSGGSKAEFFGVLFESLMGGGFSFLMTAVLTALGVAYVIKEDVKGFPEESLVRTEYAIALSYVILWGCIWLLISYSTVPYIGGFFDAKIFVAVFSVTAAFYFSMTGFPRLGNLKELEIDWGKLADSALYTTFLFCALSFFAWMTVIYYQSVVTDSVVPKTMGDNLALGWLYFFWPTNFLIIAHIHICFLGDQAQVERAFKRNWHLVELFGFFIFLTVAPPNLIDIDW